MIVSPHTVLDSGLTWGPDVGALCEGLRSYSYDGRLVATAIVQLTEQVKRIADLMDPAVKERAKITATNNQIWNMKCEQSRAFLDHFGLTSHARLTIRRLVHKEMNSLDISGLSLPEVRAKYAECLADFVLPVSISKPGTKTHANYAAWRAERLRIQEQSK